MSGFYRYVHNPIYVGFVIILTGETLLFGSAGLPEDIAVAWCSGALATRPEDRGLVFKRRSALIVMP